jgi:hypothetical protein
MVRRERGDAKEEGGSLTRLMDKGQAVQDRVRGSEAASQRPRAHALELLGPGRAGGRDQSQALKL